MKLYGSFQNRLMEGAQEIVPEIGMGATELMWSDRYPYTVVEIVSKNRIKVQEDIYTMQSNGDYEFKSNFDGVIKTLIKTSHGWKVLKGSTYFRLGIRDVYIDPSF